MTDSHLKHVLIGTAGHIDHGKTRLVGRLTGISTDRLPEEKARGISIDLGFAHWKTDGLSAESSHPTGDTVGSSQSGQPRAQIIPQQFQFGIVDVPGHERFVKNMVAGATGVNLALLVVAADDSVMPQTREHLEIMDLLGVKTGVIAVTKTDLVEPDFIELVTAEIEDLVAGTFLEGCPIVAVSSETGEGIEALKSTLLRVAAEVEWPESYKLFRMPIDRVFSISGHGTVVTGSVISGEVHAGETLELLPQQREVRIRSVQNYGAGTSESSARQRTAVNLAGVKMEELTRGFELATCGYLRPTTRLFVELRGLASSPLVLKDRLDLSLHLGTKEAQARIILKGQQLKPGQRTYAELRVKEPVVAVYGQRFILRRISPALTIAGGTVFDPYLAPGKRIRDLEHYGRSLDSPVEIDRLSFLLSQRDTVDSSPLEAAWRAGVRPDRYAGLIDKLKSEAVLVPIGHPDRRRLVHRNRLQSLAGSVLRAIKAIVARHQPSRALPRNTLMTACRAITRSDLLEAIFDYLMQKKKLVQVGSNLGPADAQVKLTKNQQQARSRMLDAIATGGLTPPTAKELAAQLHYKPDQVEPLLKLCIEDGLLIRISGALSFSPEAIEHARSVCENLLQEIGEATMSQLREAWGVSRKFAVPLCEFFDARGVTVRKDDLRIPGPNVSQPVSAENSR